MNILRQENKSASVAAGIICILLTGLLVVDVAQGAQAIPPPDLIPLNQIPVPEPPNLFQFVKSKPAAIRLGKALFWDMQAGSDGVQACASCHFHAGADNRLKNTVNPGTRGGDTTFQVRGPNDTLQPGDFPFHDRQNPTTPGGQVLRDSNDVVGSQGVKLTQFNNVVLGSPVDAGTPLTDSVFQINGANMRRVTARNTPSNINAVFNFNNFWDGRAHFVFNGVNPFGPLDPGAGVWFNSNGTLVKQPVAITHASLASQATGPPLDDTEMSFRGRTFPQLGRKMLSLTPLGQQTVHPRDGVLGPFSRAVVQPGGKVGGSKGLSTSYTQMIKDAFQNNLWDSIQLTPGGFTQMESNFSLYWGLAIQLYEATLVSDQTPFDRFLGGDKTALTSQQQDGFNLFFGAGGCNVCHIGTEQTNASVRFAAWVTNSFHNLMETMAVKSGQQIIYDNGYNNTAVRPIGDDIGRAGNAPFTNTLTGLPFPLAYSSLAELQAVGNLGFNPNLFQPGTPATPILPAQLPANFPVSNSGSFKVPGLRNIELTAPYFHNGGDMTLQDVVEFYARGGNFPVANAAAVDAAFQDIGSLQNDQVKIDALVAFMMAMTDERVRNESEPFDHPELSVPAGDGPLIYIPARDASGTAAVTLNVTISPFATPTNKTSILFSGTMDAGTTVNVLVNNGTPSPADTSTGTTWSKQVSGLAGGSSIITVTATDLQSNVATATAEVLIVLPTGDLNGSGVVDISDSLRALQIANGLIVPTQMELLRGDVAPQVNGVPAPDDSITISDALLILRKVVGLASF
jgi:cytochrome c peroxidase